MPTLSFKPRGLVVYPSNNSRLKGYAFYKAGVRAGYLASTKPKALKGVHAGQSVYTVNLNLGGTATVAGATKLNKKAINRVFDADSWQEAGDFRWEEVINPDGKFRARCDSTGEFQVIATTFRKLFGAATKPFANVHDDVDPEGTAEQTRENFFDALAGATEGNLDYFAYAGHGMPNSLPSAQVRKADLDRLVKEVRRLLRKDGTVIFYACSTGASGGFASKISVALPQATVWGHTDSGTASRNADKYRYRNGLGVDLRTLLSSTARAKFAKYLLASPDFYARLPFMTVEEIEAELA